MIWCKPLYLFALTALTLLMACNREAGAPIGDGGAMATDHHAGEPAKAYVDLSPEAFAEKMGSPDVVVLDVRTPAEIAGGKIEGAVELDYKRPDFAEALADLDPSKTYLVYCAVGGRSSKACELLAERGVGEVYNLRGGYAAWAR